MVALELGYAGISVCIWYFSIEFTSYLLFSQIRAFAIFQSIYTILIVRLLELT